MTKPLWTQSGERAGVAGASNVAGEVFGKCWEHASSIRRTPREGDSEGFIERKVFDGIVLFLESTVAPF